MKKVLVIHPEDSSTDMLQAVYFDKGYDVIRDQSISNDELVEQIRSHDKIIMLGHGTPDGLIACDRKNFMFRYIILERYDADDPITQFNRRNILIIQ